MKVGEVTRLLEGIATGLGELSKKTSEGLSGFHMAMEPFADQTVEQFIGFLGQCKEFAETGKVAQPGKKSKATATQKASPLSVADAAARVNNLLGEINQGAVTSMRIDSMLAEIDKELTKPKWDELLKTLNISGKASSKPKAIAMLRQVLTTQLEMHVKAQAFGSRG